MGHLFKGMCGLSLINAPGGCPVLSVIDFQLAFKRIKLQQPSLSMTDINKLVAAEWAEVKAKKALQATSASLLAERLESLSM